MTKLVKLSNNMEVVMERIPHVRTVTLGIWVRNGSRNENEETNGISHFIEHMLFKGTEKLSAKDIADKMDEVGGQLNAFTSKEFTCYYSRVLDTHLDVAIDTLSDMFLNSKFDSKEIDKERNVIIEEINMYEDSPDDLAMDLIQMSSWDKDSLGMPIIGTKENILRFKQEDFLNFINEKYFPANTVIAVCGNFDEDEIIEKLENAFGNYTNNGDYKRPEFNTEYKQGIITREKDIEQVHMIMAFPGIGMEDEDNYTMNVLNTILGGGMSSRLFQSVREEKGLVYNIFSYNASFYNIGLYTIYAALNKNQVEELYKTVKEEIHNLSTDKITEEKLESTKEQLKSRYLMSHESTGNRMNAIGRSQIMLGRVLSPDETIKKIDEVTLDGIYKLIDKTFDFDKMSVCGVGNIKNIDFGKLI